MTTESQGSAKSFTTTWLLSLFVGLLGVDRFDLGKVGTGLAKLFTFAGFGVWYLVDLVLILLGKAQDKKGQPLEGYEKSRLVALVVTAVLLLAPVSFGIIGANTAPRVAAPQATVTVTKSEEPEPSASETATAESTTSASPTETSEPTTSAEPTPEETPTPLEAKPFFIQATNDLDDLFVDIADSFEDLEKENSLQVMGNSLELMWNLTQLQSTYPPTEYQEDWSTVLAELELAIDAYTDAVSAWVSEEIFLEEVTPYLEEVEDKAKKVGKFLGKVQY